MKKLLTLLIALVICFGSVVGVRAADDNGDAGTTETEEQFDVSGSKTADPTFLMGDEKETTVTLQLPAGEYQNEIDIVFTMDSSTSAQNGAVFIEPVENLFASILENNPNIVLKVGVIRFRGQAYDTLDKLSNGQYSGLVVYSDETKDLISSALKLKEKDMPQSVWGRGSNLHAGLVKAEEMLASDELLSDDHKYVVALTDCKTYIWNDDKGNAVCYYSQWYDGSKSPRNTISAGGSIVVAQKASYNKYSYFADVLDPTGGSNVFKFNSHQPVDSNSNPEVARTNRYLNFVDLYNSEDPELTGDTGLEETCYYAIDGSNPTGEYIKHETTNGAYLFGSNGTVIKNGADLQYYYEFIPDPDYTGIKYYQANPYMVIENADGTYTFDTDNINPYYYQYHVDSLQKASYKSAHKWTDLKEKYNAAVIVYTGGGMDNALTNVRGGFIPWIMNDENSDYYADVTTAAQVEALFEGIDNSIRYMVSKGVVTDKITDDFTLKNADNKDGFRMTLSGEALPVTYADGKWNFGTADDENVYPYVVEYDADTKTITWTINVPIENLNPVTLSYDLILDEDAESAVYPTNVSALLDYESTDGKHDGEYTFEVPEVVYIKLIDINVKKVWDDNDDDMGARPDKVEVVLVVDEEEVDNAELNEKNEWKATFEDLPDSTYDNGEFTPIEYDIQEIEVTDYTTEITEDEEAENSYIITNTFVPRVVNITITKVWDDNNDEAGMRPESITLHLLADDEVIADLVITADDVWAYNAEELPAGYYVDGEFVAYEYSVTEDAVDNYDTEITDEFEDGEYTFTVTNTYTPPTPPTGGPETMTLGLLLMSTSLTGMTQIMYTVKRRKEEE